MREFTDSRPALQEILKEALQDKNILPQAKRKLPKFLGRKETKNMWVNVKDSIDKCFLTASSSFFKR